MTTRPPRPFKDVRGTGLLWYLNKTALHPRGFALAFHQDDNGEIVGWSLLGDGKEVWRFTDQSDEEGFRKWEDFLTTLKMDAEE